MTTGWRIKEIRSGLGMDQQQFADRVGVHKITVSKWETNKVVPETANVEAIAQLSGRDMEWILHGPPSLPATETPPADRHKSLEAMFLEVKALNERLAKVESERAASLIRVPEANPRRVNRRDELAKYRVSKRGGQGVQLPKWLNLACGVGCELERTKDLIYFSGISNSKGLHTAVCRGESMADTIQHGDVVILEEFAGGPAVLEPLGDDPKNSYRKLQERGIYQDSICVVSINDDAPTMKRVYYQTAGNVLDWTLVIYADNTFEWKPRPIGRQDRVTFWAKMIGIADNIR